MPTVMVRERGISTMKFSSNHKGECSLLYRSVSLLQELMNRPDTPLNCVDPHFSLNPDQADCPNDLRSRSVSRASIKPDQYGANK
jgi:hypothetical protein